MTTSDLILDFNKVNIHSSSYTTKTQTSDCQFEVTIINFTLLSSPGHSHLFSLP